MVRLLHYAGCSTCRRGRALLQEVGCDVDLVDLAAAPPDAAALRDLVRRSGLPIAAFFNTSGRSYREGGWSERRRVASEDEQLAALAADGMLVKRPILDLGDDVLVGLREDAWRAALAR